MVSGTALMVFLNGTLKSGIETVLDLVDFDEHLKDVDIVVTGEGATDWQSVFGKSHAGSWCTLQKAPYTSCSDCRKYGKRCRRYLRLWN